MAVYYVNKFVLHDFGSTVPSRRYPYIGHTFLLIFSLTKLMFSENKF